MNDELLGRDGDNYSLCPQKNVILAQYTKIKVS